MRIGSTQQSNHRRAAAIVAAVTFATFGSISCSSEKDTLDSGHVDHEPDAGGCAARDGVDTFSAGMSKTGEAGITVQLVSSDPAPPRRFDNFWSLYIEDGSGPLAEGWVHIEATMPLHGGHPSPRLPVVTEISDGTYEARVNFSMPGLWSAVIEVGPDPEAEEATDSVSFLFCID